MSTLGTCFSPGLHGLTYKQTRIAAKNRRYFLNIFKSAFIQIFCIYIKFSKKKKFNVYNISTMLKDTKQSLENVTYNIFYLLQSRTNIQILQKWRKGVRRGRGGEGKEQEEEEQEENIPTSLVIGVMLSNLSSNSGSVTSIAFFIQSSVKDVLATFRKDFLRSRNFSSLLLSFFFFSGSFKISSFW